MSNAETSKAKNPSRIDVFRYDWTHMLKFLIDGLKFYLAFLCFGIFAAIGTEFDTWANWIYVMMSAAIYIPVEIHIRRAQADLALLAVGPEGVSVHINGITTIGWENITRVQAIKRQLGHYQSESLGFTFRKGSLKFRKFGVLTRDRWTVPIFFANRAGASLLLEGGIDPIIASIERFHTVERN